MEKKEALEFLRLLEEYRQDPMRAACYNNTLRLIEAAIAGKAGYTNRNAWTKELKEEEAK